MRVTDVGFQDVSLDDLDALRAMASRIWWSCYRGMIPDAQIEQMLGWMYTPEQVASELAKGVRWEWLEVSGERRGYLSWEPGGPGLLLHKLYGTHVPWQGLGPTHAGAHGASSHPARRGLDRASGQSRQRPRPACLSQGRIRAGCRRRPADWRRFPDGRPHPASGGGPFWAIERRWRRGGDSNPR